MLQRVPSVFLPSSHLLSLCHPTAQLSPWPVACSWCIWRNAYSFSWWVGSCLDCVCGSITSFRSQLWWSRGGGHSSLRHSISGGSLGFLGNRSPLVPTDLFHGMQPNIFRNLFLKFMFSSPNRQLAVLPKSLLFSVHLTSVHFLKKAFLPFMVSLIWVNHTAILLDLVVPFLVWGMHSIWASICVALNTF